MRRQIQGQTNISSLPRLIKITLAANMSISLVMSNFRTFQVWVHVNRKHGRSRLAHKPRFPPLLTTSPRKKRITVLFTTFTANRFRLTPLANWLLSEMQIDVPMMNTNLSRETPQNSNSTHTFFTTCKTEVLCIRHSPWKHEVSNCETIPGNVMEKPVIATFIIHKYHDDQ